MRPIEWSTNLCDMQHISRMFFEADTGADGVLPPEHHWLSALSLPSSDLSKQAGVLASTNGKGGLSIGSCGLKRLYQLLIPHGEYCTEDHMAAIDSIKCLGVLKRI